jgi:hypothetical protein
MIPWNDELMTFEDFQIGQGVVEIRHPKAHRYWDDCGKLIAALERKLPGLVAQKLGPKGFEFDGVEALGIAKAMFFWNRVEVTLAPQGAQSKFIESAVVFWETVRDGLSVEAIARLGHRLWVHLPQASLSEAEELLKSLPLWGFSGDRLGGFGSPRNSGIVLRSKLTDGRDVRLQVDSATMKLQDAPASPGALFDLDFTAAVPVALTADVGRFLQANYRFAKDNLPKLVEDR